MVWTRPQKVSGLIRCNGFENSNLSLLNPDKISKKLCYNTLFSDVHSIQLLSCIIVFENKREAYSSRRQVQYNYGYTLRCKSWVSNKKAYVVAFNPCGYLKRTKQLVTLLFSTKNGQYKNVFPWHDLWKYDNLFYFVFWFVNAQILYIHFSYGPCANHEEKRRVSDFLK